MKKLYARLVLWLAAPICDRIAADREHLERGLKDVHAELSAARVERERDAWADRAIQVGTKL